MKVKDLKVFIVGNPPPSWGGRYFIFVKLTTDTGISGIGECYCDTFGPKAMTAMIEDTFGRYVEGMDPFQLESLWRKVYCSGFSQRPDISLMGVLSGIEIALWDIIGKALNKPVYELLGGKVHEKLRSYTYIYPDPAKGQDGSIFWNAEQSAERAAEYVRQGFTAVKFDPAAPYSAFDPRQPSLESIDLCVKFCKLIREAVGIEGRPPVRHPWPVHRLGRHPLRQEDRALRSAVVRGADAAGEAGGDGAGGARHLHSGGHRRAPHHQVRVRPRAGMPRSLHPADGAGPRRRHHGGQEDRRHGGSLLCPDRAASLCRPGRGRGQHPLRGLAAQFPDPRKHRDMGRLPFRAPEEADPLGEWLRASCPPNRASASN